MPLPTAYFWNKAPIVRLLVALIAGILLQWQFKFPLSTLVWLSAICFALLSLYFFIPVKLKYRFGYLNGIAANFLLALVGAVLVFLHDVRHNKNWIGNYAAGDDYIIVTIKEPLTEKTNSFKALA